MAQLRQWMREERLAPGAALPGVRELVRRFGATRTTVRAALEVLADAGDVDFAETGAACVGDPAEQRIKASLRDHLAVAGLSAEDIYQVRCRLEPELAAALAGELSAQTIADLQAAIDAAERAAARGEAPAVASLAFHARLARECGNPLLRLLVEFMAEVLRDADAGDPAAQGLAHVRHGSGYQRRLLAALIEGDAGAARRIMRDHVETSQHRRESRDPGARTRFIAE